MQIQYCFECGIRLTDDDFEKGRAFHLDGKVGCAKCSPNLEATELKIIEEKPAPFRRPSSVRRPAPAPRVSRPAQAPVRKPGAGAKPARHRRARAERVITRQDSMIRGGGPHPEVIIEMKSGAGEGKI